MAEAMIPASICRPGGVRNINMAARPSRSLILADTVQIVGNAGGSGAVDMVR